MSKESVRDFEEERARQALSGLVFISVPLDVQGKLGSISIDPHRLLPVETGAPADKWDISELSWEMIVSGMLKMLAYQPDHEDTAYYRDFIREMKPGLASELTEAAIIKARNHDYDLAEEIFRALIGLEPDNCRFLLNLALLYEERASVYRNLDKSDLEERCDEQAFLWYSRALSLDEVIPEAHLYAGYFFLRQNNFDGARNELNDYLETGDDPDQIERIKGILSEIDDQDLRDTQFKEAYDFIRMGREEDGISRIDAFLSKHPDVWNAWFVKGWGLRRLGRYDDALEAFSEAIGHGAQNADAYNELAICQMETQNFVASRKSLETALRMEPDNVKIISNLGILAMRQQHNDEAIAFFRTVLELEPEDPIAARFIEELDRQ